MDNIGSFDLSSALKKLLAENNSQEAMLGEYAETIKSRDREIEMLQRMLSEANEHRSSTDNQLKELTELRHYISDLQQQVAGTVYRTTGRQQRIADTVSTEQQLQKLNLEYSFLQSQLSEVQAQFKEVNNRNLVLQQQTGRIAELESLLENARAQISHWKFRATPQHKK